MILIFRKQIFLSTFRFVLYKDLHRKPYTSQQSDAAKIFVFFWDSMCTETAHVQIGAHGSLFAHGPTSPFAMYPFIILSQHAVISWLYFLHPASIIEPSSTYDVSLTPIVILVFLSTFCFVLSKIFIESLIHLNKAMPRKYFVCCDSMCTETAHEQIGAHGPLFEHGPTSPFAMYPFIILSQHVEISWLHFAHPASIIEPSSNDELFTPIVIVPC